jgi:hypothetical protein
VSTHDLTFCLTLKAIHTLDAGQRVELKFNVPPCGDIVSGDLILRLTPASAADKYMLGDKIFVHLRGEP